MNVWFRQENTDFNRKRVEILKKLSKSQVQRQKYYPQITCLSKSIKTTMYSSKRERKLVRYEINLLSEKENITIKTFVNDICPGLFINAEVLSQMISTETLVVLRWVKAMITHGKSNEDVVDFILENITSEATPLGQKSSTDLSGFATLSDGYNLTIRMTDVIFSSLFKSLWKQESHWFHWNER